MSLPAFNTQSSLFGSVAALAGDLFEETDRYRLFAQKVWPVLAKTRAQLEACYCAGNGRASLEPVLLLGVLIFQFLERVPDRAAVEMVKYHLGWKLALNVELQMKGFHPTTLVSFRQRLVDHEQAQVAFAAVLEALQQVGLVPKKGKQRLDSTHVLGLVARLSSLECVRETLRLALEELEEKLPASERPDFWAPLWERYVEHKLDYKSNEAVLRDKHRQAGSDSLRLLQWLEPLPVEVRADRQTELLQRVFSEYYEISALGQAEPVAVHGAATVKNPHDPQAHWCAKSHGAERKEWIGYKVQVAENIAPEPAREDQPRANFLTSIVTQGATESDDAGLMATLEQQRGTGLQAPQELYVDGAYVSAENLAKAKAEGRELLGPARPSVNNPKGFRAEDFDVRIEERRAICPAQKPSTQCSRLEEKKTRKVSYRFEWSTHCHECALRESCVGAGQRHRTLVVGEYHEVLQERRREQKTATFQERMHQRNGIEGTQSELVRAHGLRRARYRGRKKLDLQNQLIGAACNIKRWLRLLAWQIAHAELGFGLKAPVAA
jgi:transposase